MAPGTQAGVDIGVGGGGRRHPSNLPPAGGIVVWVIAIPGGEVVPVSMKRATFPLLALLIPLLIGCNPVALAPTVYDQPYPVGPVVLPRDDAAHDAPIEWWYWVGHLEDEAGRELAFNLTFFKAFAPPQLRLAGIPSHWLFERGHVAHAAVVDVAEEDHRMGQRIDFFYPAASSNEELDISIGAWRATRAADGVSHHLRYSVGGYALDLTLTPRKPAALHGNPPGIQTMGPGGVSYYTAYTRMAVQGTVRGPCRLPQACPAVPVRGQAWFDHQWGDFRIDRFAGWDWFALQLDDGREVMVYLIRDFDDTIASAEGSLILGSGEVIPLGAEDFQLVTTASWRSERTGAVYPAGWTLELPAYDLALTIAPRVANQEMNTRATTGIVYWEGAVAVGGSHPGLGFVELTNYDRVPWRDGTWFGRVASGGR
jgi:predicted secreted hydrolase